MAIKVKFDLSNNPLPLRLILTTRSGKRIRELPLNNIKFKDTLAGPSEISFQVYKTRCVDTTGNIDQGFWNQSLTAQPGIEPAPPALGRRHFNHWIESPRSS